MPTNLRLSLNPRAVKWRPAYEDAVSGNRAARNRPVLVVAPVNMTDYPRIIIVIDAGRDRRLEVVAKDIESVYHRTEDDATKTVTVYMRSGNTWYLSEVESMQFVPLWNHFNSGDSHVRF